MATRATTTPRPQWTGAPRARRALADTSTALRGAFAEIGDLLKFSGEALGHAPGSMRYFAETLRQASTLILGSTVFVMFLTMGIGGECSLWFVSWARTLGATDFTGFANVPCGLNLLFPFLFAHAFAAKVGTGLVAEIGSMRITDEIDAIETTGIDSMRYVIGTRLVAVVMFVPLAYFSVLLAGLLGGWLTSVIQLGELTPARYFQGYWSGQTIVDNLESMVQVTSMCAGVTLVGLYYGYRASGGPVGVGNAVARSMIVNLIWLQFVAGFWQAVFYGHGARVPFGG